MPKVNELFQTQFLSQVCIKQANIYQLPLKYRSNCIVPLEVFNNTVSSKWKSWRYTFANNPLETTKNIMKSREPTKEYWKVNFWDKK